jgi:hypothetical protein
MTALDNLIQSTEYHVEFFRCHTLGMWDTDPLEEKASNECIDCGMAVFVDTNPPPNGIDVSGQAVALQCE